MRKYYREIAVILVLLISQSISGQTVNSTQSNDSVNSVLLQNFNKKIVEVEIQRIADSTKRAQLEKQILALKASDKLKKDELQKRLYEISNNEAIRLAEKKARIDSLRLTAKSFPVYGSLKDTLLFIYNKLGSFSAQERAEAITKRIKNISSKFRYKPDSLKIIEAETTIDLVFGETIIMSISENDAIWNNSSKLEYAKKCQLIISDSVLKYKSETSFATLAKEIGLAILVLIILGTLISLIRRLFKWTAIKIQIQEEKRIKGIKIKNYTLFDAKKQVQALLTINNFLKWVFILILVYIALPILFGIFPWTKNFANTLLNYILEPLKNIALGLWNYLPNLITIIVIVIVFRYVLKGIGFLKDEIEKGDLSIPGFYADWANPTYQIIRVIVIAFMLVVIWQYLPGSDSKVFQGVSVFLGVLFTFGSAGSLSNIIAGLVLTYMRLFKIGDRVKIGEIVGDVIEKSLLVTRIKTIKNEIISIPNSTVMSSHTINYSSETVDKGLILHTTVTIGYDVPWKDMHQALLNAADRTDLLLKEPNPFVLQTSLDDFYVSYQINAYTKEANKQATIYSQLHSNIQDCCNEDGIEILSPHYRAERDGNLTTIPANYLSKDYKAPVFNVSVKKEE
jgi:small-conductance mechanosensitive channel